MAVGGVMLPIFRSGGIPSWRSCIVLFEICVQLLCLTECLKSRFLCSWKRLWFVANESMFCAVLQSQIQLGLSCDCQGARI